MRNNLLMIFTCAVLLSISAEAQEAAPAAVVPSVPQIQPPTQTAPAVVPQPSVMPPPAQGYFPQLPQANRCLPKDINGIIWKLVNVYETPVGAAIASFNDEPHQFVGFFRIGNAFREIKSAQQ